MNLKDSLSENNSIALQQIAKDWKEAIKIGTDLLVKANAIEERYYDEILKNTEEYGPYYIIIPGVAMPHARPEAGVLKDSFSLVTLKEPVKFEEGGDEVYVLITLAATSCEKHNECGIVQVAELFEDEENVERIKNAKSIEEILNLI